MKTNKDSQYFSFNNSDPIYEDIIGFISDKIESIDSIVDVGCGGGYLAEKLSSLFPDLKITVIDADRTLLRSIETPSIKKIYGIMPGLSLDEKFDFVIAKDVIEHIPDAYQAITELTKMSSKYLFLSAPGPFTEAAWGDLTHVRPYNRTTFRHISKIHNLRIILMGASRRNIFIKFLAKLIRLNIDEISVYAIYEHNDTKEN
jgi:trans-aconitate methyltransferase